MRAFFYFRRPLGAQKSASCTTFVYQTQYPGARQRTAGGRRGPGARGDRHRDHAKGGWWRSWGVESRIGMGRRGADRLAGARGCDRARRGGDLRVHKRTRPCRFHGWSQVIVAPSEHPGSLLGCPVSKGGELDDALSDGREQEHVWELRAEGHSSRAIGRELGLRPQYVSLCVALIGGVRPPVRNRSQRCLTKTEREEISRGLARGDGFRAIAVRISRSHTAVSREVNRNGGRARYRAQHAEAAAWDRARRPKPSKLALNSTLRARVEEKLELRWSPQQISQWLRRTYGDDEAMQVSHETIYLSLFVQSRGALRRELSAHLRSGRRARQARAQRSNRQG
jgi:hypothetical protein